MLAFYGVPIRYPRYSHADQSRTIAILNRPSSSAILWPKGGMDNAAFPPYRAPSGAEVGAVEAAAARVAPTPMVLRTAFLDAKTDGCSAPDRLHTYATDGDGFWQSFLIVERTMVALSIHHGIARAATVVAPTPSEESDLEAVVDRLSFTRDGAPGQYVVLYEE